MNNQQKANLLMMAAMRLASQPDTPPAANVPPANQPPAVQQPPAAPPVPNNIAPPVNVGAQQTLTLEQIGAMSADDINSNWDAVSQVLGGAPASG